MIEFLQQINPGLYFILSGFLCATLLSYIARKVMLVLTPLLVAFALFQLFGNQPVTGGVLLIGGQEFITLHTDRLSLVWGYIFCLAGVINGIYSFHEKCTLTDSSALIYMGAAVGGVFAGDLLTLFVFWELAAISSVVLIWKGGKHAVKAGLRYLTIHVFSGVLLLAGVVIFGHANNGDYSFNHIGLDAPGGWLIFIAIGIKCGFPLLHNWIQDAYPKASITGTVILSAFTTKLALYALARGFAGTESLIYIGAIMTVFPVFFAVIENDLRRVLSYSLNNQMGFMVCGIGIGTPLAMNGVTAHVVADIIFKGLLFMSMGAVMLRTGTAKASELGGLFRSMPYTAICCLIGAGSIAAFPLLSAFVTKSMILTAALLHAEHSHLWRDWLVLAMLLFASAGVMEHSGIKVPYFSFFGHDSGKRVEEAPWNMLIAMGLAASLCILFGIPGGYTYLYALLPYKVDFHPYTPDHVIFQFQLLFAAMFAFALLKRWHVYPRERRAEILDSDWLYRRLGWKIVIWISAMWTRLEAHIRRHLHIWQAHIRQQLFHLFSPVGTLSETVPASLAAVLTVIMLATTFVLVFASNLIH